MFQAGFKLSYEVVRPQYGLTVKERCRQIGRGQKICPVKVK